MTLESFFNNLLFIFLGYNLPRIVTLTSRLSNSIARHKTRPILSEHDQFDTQSPDPFTKTISRIAAHSSPVEDPILDSRVTDLRVFSVYLARKIAQDHFPQAPTQERQILADWLFHHLSYYFKP